jgi:hypothetical protein
MSKFKHYRASIFAGVALSVFATMASAAEWRLVDIAGPVRVAVLGGAPAAGAKGQALPTGTSVTTAAGGRATLDNGEQHIVVGPNSRLTVQPDQGGFTRIAQDLGAAMFKVDKKNVPHFRVDTPLLAAIVKGTTFTVMVEGTSDAVSVAEGLVEVRSNQNGMVGDVAAGATGTVLRDAPGAVQVMTPAAEAAVAPAPPPINIAPIDYKAASGGLIDVAPAVATSGAVQAAQAVVLRAAESGPSNNASGASVQDTPAAAATTVSVAVVASQIAGLQAGQREIPIQIARPVEPGAGNGTDPAGSVLNANGNNGVANGVSGNGNGNGNGNNGNGNGGSNNGVVTGVVTAVTNTTGGLTDTLGSAPGGNGNSGGNANGNNGNANGNSGNGNGNNGNGNGNGGSNNVAPVVPTVVATVTGTIGGLLGGNGNGNSGNGNSGSGNSGNGTGNGNGKEKD